MRKLLSISIPIGLLLCVSTTFAQVPDDGKKQIVPIGAITQITKKADADRLPDSLVATPKKHGLIRRIFDYFDRSNVDRTFEKKIDWSIAPGPSYSSDVGFGLGFLLAGIYRIDRTDSITAPSNISIYGNFTTKKFVLLRFSGDNVFAQNDRRLSYSGAFVYFPGAFYGVGYRAGKEGYAQSLTTTMGIFRVSWCSAVAGRFFLGASGGIDYSGASYTGSGMVDYMNEIKNGEKPIPNGELGELFELWQEGRYDPMLQDPFSNYIRDTGDKPNAFNTNIGLFAQYDTRDITYNATRGIFVKAEAKYWPTTSMPTAQRAIRRGTCMPRWAAWNGCAATTKAATATNVSWRRNSNCDRKSIVVTEWSAGLGWGKSGARNTSAGTTRCTLSA